MAARYESPPPTEESTIPEDIPSPQGDDIVAKQLREAAMAEQDPDLKANCGKNTNATRRVSAPNHQSYRSNHGPVKSHAALTRPGL